MKTLPKPAVMIRAFRSKDASFEGVFFVGIRTTGVFCRPTCRAKMARESNMEFFADAAAALHDGYRPCKLCRPMEHEPAALVKRLMAQVETAAGRVTERELRAMGVDPSTARRQFQRHCRMTFAAYQRAWRVGAAAGRMARGAPVISGQLAAGYASASGFRAARKRMLGTKGTAALWSKRFQTPLGPMIGICSDEGILVADFVDRKGLAAEIERLQGRDKTPIVPGDHQHLKMLATQLAEYFAGTRQLFSLPLAEKGSPLQKAAWKYLQTIPYAQTRSYADQARALGTPRAVRAVGRANGKNYVEIVIPCHRVIASSGELSGYGGGLARKRWLLAHEKAHENGPV